LSLTPAQKAFATSREAFPAFVGGFGSGKTAAAIARAMALKTHFKSADIAYYLPTFPLVEDIAMRRFPELCERKGWAFKKRGGTSPHIEFPGAGRILFRSMSNPDAIVGYEVAHSICDELDTLPIENARQAWNKIIARNRQKCGMANTVAVATTPEGFRFVHERWVKKPAPGYVLFRAKTMDNAANLPEGYIDNLRNSYPTQLLSAYLDGEFVNLTAGSVYAEYDRVLNASTETVKDNEPLHIGMDFNVAHGAAVVHVLRGDDPHAVHEYTDVFDTPAMIALIKRDFAGHPILIYPDASGGNRKSNNASESDISLLKAAGFRVCNNASNPAVKDRILAFNALINKNFIRRYRVNPEKCPNLVESLEKQAYNKNGEPDKTTGLDHILDAAGYMVVYRYPLTARPAMSISMRSATN
jgi:Terminase large subunit, T4likevirus-type, N-terminal/Terminase RNaseH-like domain